MIYKLNFDSINGWSQVNHVGSVYIDETFKTIWNNLNPEKESNCNYLSNKQHQLAHKLFNISASGYTIEPLKVQGKLWTAKDINMEV